MYSVAINMATNTKKNKIPATEKTIENHKIKRNFVIFPSYACMCGIFFVILCAEIDFLLNTWEY